MIANTALILRISIISVSVLLSNNSFAKEECDFVSLGCQGPTTCAQYRPKGVYLFGGHVADLFEQYKTGLIQKGVDFKKITNDFEITYFDNTNIARVVRLPKGKKGWLSKDKVIEYFTDEVKDKEGEKKFARKLKQNEEISAMSANGDIFACVVKSNQRPEEDKSKAGGDKKKKKVSSDGKYQNQEQVGTTTNTSKDNIRDEKTLYSIHEDESNPLPPSELENPNAAPSWLVNSPQTTVQLGSKLPAEFHASLLVKSQDPGEIIVGCSAANGEKPNIRLVTSPQGSVLIKQDETDTELKRNPFVSTGNKKIKIDLYRDKKSVKVLVNNAPILSGTLESNEIAAMTRFFVGGNFIINDLTIYDISKGKQ